MQSLLIFSQLQLVQMDLNSITLAFVLQTELGQVSLQRIVVILWFGKSENFDNHNAMLMGSLVKL